MSKVILIMAGGTGGHIFPGLAVADALRERGWRVAWLGTRDGMEAELVPRHGYELTPIRFQGVRGKGLAALLLLPGRLLLAFWQAAGAIRRIAPDVVLGMGGYVAFPGGMIASLLNKPLVIHEQNAVAGTTSKLLAKIADRVLTSYESAFGPRDAVLQTGNPVRSTLACVPHPQMRFAERGGRVRVTILGGSLGARALNELLPSALAALALDARPEVVHQAGRQHAAEVEARYRGLGVEARVVAFVEDMATQLAWSDLVVCRAGATTLAELAAVGVGSLLIPFPFAIDDHQTHNAQALAARSAAIVVPQAELSVERLLQILRDLDRQRLLAMACAARSLGRPDAAQRVADECERIARRAGDSTSRAKARP